MALASLSLAAIVLAAAPIMSGPADWLSQAQAGRLACAAPNAAKKSCISLARYSLSKNGTVEESAETLIPLQPPLTFTTKKTFRIRSGSACGIFTQKDIDSAVFFREGRPVQGRKVEQVREVLNNAFLDYVDREICMSFVPSGSSFEARVSVGGLDYPHLSQPVIWVRPTDGFTV